MPPKYEYKSVALGGKAVYQKDVIDRLLPVDGGHDENILNSYGKDGWELVSAYCWSAGSKNQHQYYFKRELQQEQQVDETEGNADEILSDEMNKLKVDAEPPAPTPVVFNFGTPAPTPGVFAFGTPAPTFEKPPEKPTAEDAGTEVDILRRDLDDLRNDFDKVRRKLGKTLGIGLRTKEEEFEDIKRPNCGLWSDNSHISCSFKGMTFKDYRAWKSDFETYYREQQKQREKETEGVRRTADRKGSTGG